LIERSFQGLSIAIKTVEIIEELVEIWPNEVCDTLAVQHLPIHLPNEHYVNFHVHQTVNEVLARQNVKKTQLTAWFDYNSTYDNGLGLTY